MHPLRETFICARQDLASGEVHIIITLLHNKMSEKFLLQTTTKSADGTGQYQKIKKSNDSQLMVQDSTIKSKNHILHSDWLFISYNKN